MEPPPGSWHPAWAELLGVAALCAAYAGAVARHGAGPARVAAFAVSQAMLVALFATPAHTVAVHYLLSAHLFQNVVLAEWAPALAVLGVSAPIATSLAGRQGVRAATHPLVALPLWAAAYVVWHVPAVYDAALRNHALLALEHASYFLTGLALWWPVFQDDPHRLSNGGRSAYVLAAFLLASPIALLLTFLPEPVYGFYEAAPRLWGLSPLTDQQVAGVIMSASEAVVFFVVFAVFLFRFFADEA